MSDPSDSVSESTAVMTIRRCTMGKQAKRAALLSVAIAGVALIGSGCHAAKGPEAASSAGSATSSVADAPSGTATASPQPTTAQIAGADGKQYTVEGPILQKYNSLDEAAKTFLGKPTGNADKEPNGGVMQMFDGGVICSHQTQAFVVSGKILDKWNELGGSPGKLGFPTSDESTGSGGGKQQTFQNGTVTWKLGDAGATVIEQ
jgi:uncharacterized protein with LGFP repeats